MEEKEENYTNYSGKHEVRVIRKVHNHNKNVSCPRMWSKSWLANRSEGRKENERVEGGIRLDGHLVELNCRKTAGQMRDIYFQ